ncbi:rhodanese-like domain-containing protein [Desulfurivibrio alkaliphilus]|uniref:Rhodanese domain protein n=1 Tax=Desulfurivibrio alkaliphilus (strain DSM 19089 / UNIQEM U267 / AHT2) TaxID=589865 RepID=D6Z0F8_DESAT|nr:rhodanese-like domain-containing protein [Desulfurivibrio alkaliphilus]ADH85187.1 Rhodanese domain protein [Desulfurivibrio alkaliphilus AHT 2]
MNWKRLFSRTPSLSPAEARQYIEKHPAADFQLLDVRQPKEYEAEHLPGAKLIPIKELPDRQAELDPDRPVLVYCAVGGRSRAAAQYLNGQGFKEVYNMAGGIKAWQGGKAAGPLDAGLELLPATAEYDEAAALAYAMEDGLQRFYLKLAAGSEEAELATTYRHLAGLEDFHKKRLAREYREQTGQTLAPAEADEQGEQGELMESGQAPSVFEAATPAEIMEQAMGLEFQAQDLYLRLAEQSRVAASREFFLAMAAEEKEHLAFLAKELEGLKE